MTLRQPRRMITLSLMVRPVALIVAIATSLLVVSNAGGDLAQTPKRGGIARFVSPVAEPSCLNPLLATCVGPGVAGTTVYAEEVLASAFEVGPDNAYREKLVSDVEYTTEPPFTLTYSIRPEARWSDGVPITAADFDFTYQAHKTLDRKGTLSPFQRLMVDNVRRVTTVDRKTVKVVLRSRLADWRGLFQNVLPRHALAGNDLEKVWRDGIDNPRTGAPIGSGPFLIERWERGQKLTLRRNPNYFGRHRAYLDRIEVRFITAPGDRVAAVRSGAADFAVGLGDPDVVRELRGAAALRVLVAQGTGVEHFALRLGPGGHPALRNKLVRQALAYGIDRGALLRGVFAGVPGVRPADSAVFLPSSADYRPNWSRYRHRPAEARRLLEQAGCRRQLGRRNPLLL